MRRRLLRASVAVALVTAVVKLVTLLREILVAGRFGVGDDIDVFVTAFTPVAIGAALIGAFSLALVPAYVRRQSQQDEPSANDLVSELVLPVLLTLLVITMLAAVSAPAVVALFAPGYSPEKRAAAVGLYYLMLPILPLAGIAAICSGVLNARAEYGTAAAAPVLVPLSVIATLSLLPQQVSVRLVATATTIGFVAQAAILLFRLRALGVGLRPRWGPLSADARGALGEYWPMVLSQLILSGTALVDQAMTSALSPGSVATLSYGGRLTAQLASLATVTLGTVLLPIISKVVADDQFERLRSEIRRGVTILLVISVPATLSFIVLSRPIVDVLYLRGAMVPADAEAIAVTQSMFAIQLPFVLVSAVFVRVLIALRRSRVLLAVSVVSLVANAALNWVLMRSLGVAGVALSTSLVYAVSCTIFWVLSFAEIRRRQRVADGLAIP